jgi:hypothetical protein
MKFKFEQKITKTIIYDTEDKEQQENYGGNKTISEMAEIDMRCAKDDPFLFFEFGDVEWSEIKIVEKMNV